MGLAEKSATVGAVEVVEVWNTSVPCTIVGWAAAGVPASTAATVSAAKRVLPERRSPLVIESPSSLARDRYFTDIHICSKHAGVNRGRRARCAGGSRGPAAAPGGFDIAP